MKVFDYEDMGGKRFWDYLSNGTSPESDGICPILVTERAIEMGDLLIIDNTAYSVRSISREGDKRDVCYVRRLKNQAVFVGGDEPYEQNYTNEITCPYCGCEIESWEMDDEDEEHICENCGSTFSYQRDVTVSYCSQPVKKADVIRLEES